jgi:hypothetical protein
MLETNRVKRKWRLCELALAENTPARVSNGGGSGDEPVVASLRMRSR